ncbi:MAG: response regulator [Candidatus Eisenbacteria bacterium]|nr:response regulator [Candidatus Latescibacterota bacterium]MBD3302573.1 response regulator [Candidatus Eisenbacteria bacterium]
MGLLRESLRKRRRFSREADDGGDPGGRRADRHHRTGSSQDPSRASRRRRAGDRDRTLTPGPNLPVRQGMQRFPRRRPRASPAAPGSSSPPATIQITDSYTKTVHFLIVGTGLALYPSAPNEPTRPGPARRPNPPPGVPAPRRGSGRVERSKPMFGRSSHSRAVPATVPVPSHTLHRVLMVEDDVDFAADMRAILNGTVLLSRVNGSAEAAAELLRGSFDLLWLDLDLPPLFAESGTLEGLAFLGHVRRRYGRGLPVLVVSGRLTPNLTARLKRLGAIGILPKPPDPARLRALLSSLPRTGGASAYGSSGTG